MTSGDHNDGAAPTGAASGRAARAWAWVVDGLAALGTVLIGALMAIICADVVARNFAGASLPLISELGALALVMIVYLQLATTIRADRLARMDVLFVALRARAPRLGAVLAAAFDLTAAAVVGAVAWSTVGILGKDLASGEYIGVAGVATLQVWPFRVLILIGATVAAVEALRRAAVELSAVRTGAASGGTPA